jgi:hypothetical protein
LVVGWKGSRGLGREFCGFAGCGAVELGRGLILEADCNEHYRSAHLASTLFVKLGWVGLEPTTNALKGRCSIEMRTPIGNNAIRAFRRVAFAAVADYRMIWNTRSDWEFVYGSKIDQSRTAPLQQKKLYVIVPMDLHPFLADADTVFKSFDEDPVVKKRGRAEVLQRD